MRDLAATPMNASLKKEAHFGVALKNRFTGAENRNRGLSGIRTPLDRLVPRTP